MTHSLPMGEGGAAQWAHRFFDLSPEALAVLDTEGGLLQANPAWSALVGWTPEHLKAEGCWCFVHPEEHESLRARLEALRGTDARTTFQCRWRCADGTWARLDWSVVASAQEGLLYCTVRPLATESRDTAEALQRSERSFRKLIESLPDGLYVHRDQHIIYVNASLRTALGYTHSDELLGRSIWSLFQEGDLPRMRQRVATAMTGAILPVQEVRYLRRDGSFHEAESTGLTVELDGQLVVVVVVRDITERKRMQAQLLRTDRMALVGMLAAGVGHEINNPLSYVLTNLRLALENTQRLRAPEGLGAQERADNLQETEEMLQEAHEGGLRVRDIVRDLKLFSRQPEETRAELDVLKPLEFSLKMAMSELRSRAQLVKRYEPVPPVFADESRLGQVFLNLLMNAIQALPEGGAAHHRICVWVRPSPTGGVAIDVEDTGTGIAPELLERIFDPFFTTKPVGTGTGLGLSICHGILHSLGGSLSVLSELGRGTTFTVLLPAVASAPASRIPDTND